MVLFYSGNQGDSDDEDGRTTAAEIRNATGVTFGEQDETGVDGAMSPTAMALLNRLTEYVFRCFLLYSALQKFLNKMKLFSKKF